MTGTIITLPVDYDNYTYIVTDGNDACVVDATSAEPVLTCLRQNRLQCRLILSTHHHGDHTGGNSVVKKETGCMVLGGDRRISGIDRTVDDNMIISEGPFTFRCIAVPGHTDGCRAYYFEESNALFTGDTLFHAGCGRVFEGPPERLYHSLEKLRQLPATTNVYCGHEYTLDNLAFALSVEPGNRAVAERITAVEKLRDGGIPSGPALLALEYATNPFFRTGEAQVRKTVNLPGASDEAVFTELRRRKNQF